MGTYVGMHLLPMFSPDWGYWITFVARYPGKNTQGICNLPFFFFYLPSAVFIALMLVGPIKRLKQIIQIKHNRVKKPNWPEANQLAIYKHGQGFELGTTVNKSSQRSGRDLNSAPPNCKSSALTAQPRCLHTQ